MIGPYVYCKAFNAAGLLTGDAANITGRIGIDDGALTDLTNNSATEVGNGVYRFSLSDEERLGAQFVFDFASSTSGVQVFPMPQLVEPTIGKTLVLPIATKAPDRSGDASLTVYIGETVAVSVHVFEDDGTTAIDVSAETLVVAIEQEDGTDLALVTSGDIAVSGDDSNIVTFAVPAAVTTKPRLAEFSIRRAGGDKGLFAKGTLCVMPAALADS